MMYELKLDIYQISGLAAIMFWVGNYLQKKIPFLLKYCIPAPLIGGLLFAIFNTIMSSTGMMQITFDGTLQTFFMTVFFTTIGFTASFPILKKGGKQILIILVLTLIMIVAQNIIGCGIAGAFGLDARLGLTAGSVALVGGPGTAAAFGALMDGMGITGSSTLGLAAATFGLVMGSVMGGPIAHKRIVQFNLRSNETVEETEDIKEEESFASTASKFVQSAMLLALAMGVGSVASILLSKTGMTFPSYIGAMLMGAIIRNILDAMGKPFPEPENDALANISLSLFLTMALMSLKIWQLVDLAVPIIVILAAQVAFMFLFSYWVVFNIAGKDYESAVATAGYIGFNTGAMYNAMANMQVITKQYGPARTAYFVVPIVGIFSDFFNAVIITSFLNFLA